MITEFVYNQDLAVRLKTGRAKGWLLLHVQPAGWTIADAPRLRSTDPPVRELGAVVRWLLVWEGQE